MLSFELDEDGSEGEDEDEEKEDEDYTSITKAVKRPNGKDFVLFFVAYLIV